MRVLWIIPGDPASKANMVFAKRSIPALEARGIRVETFHVTSRSDPSELLGLWRRARRLVADFQPDLVHGQYGSITGVFACSLGRPAAVTFRGSDVNGDPDLPWYREAVAWTGSQMAASLCDAAIYVSEPLRRRLVFPGRLSTCLPSPVDLDVFRPLPKEACRARLGLPREGKMLSFVSVSGRGLKRPELARAVCERLGARFLEIRGVDPADIPAWLCASDGLLFTSLREGSPNAVREALACGVPVVSVRVGDVERWVSLDPWSRLAPSDSVRDLARCAAQVWDLPEPRRRRADLSWISVETHALALASLYKNVARPQLAKGAPPRRIGS